MLYRCLLHRAFGGVDMFILNADSAAGCGRHNPWLPKVTVAEVLGNEGSSGKKSEDIARYIKIGV